MRILRSLKILLGSIIGSLLPILLIFTYITNLFEPPETTEYIKELIAYLVLSYLLDGVWLINIIALIACIKWDQKKSIKLVAVFLNGMFFWFYLISVFYEIVFYGGK